MLYDVLGEHIISHIAVFGEMWKTQGKSLKAQAIYINSAKQDQGYYIPQESIIKDSTAQDSYTESSEKKKFVKIDQLENTTQLNVCKYKLLHLYFFDKIAFFSK